MGETRGDGKRESEYFEKIVNAAAASASARRPGVYVCALPSRHTSVSYDRKSQSHIDTDNTNHSAGRPSQAGLRKGAPAFHPSQAKRVALRIFAMCGNERVTDVERRAKVEELLTDSLPNNFRFTPRILPVGGK